MTLRSRLRKLWGCPIGGCWHRRHGWVFDSHFRVVDDDMVRPCRHCACGHFEPHNGPEPAINQVHLGPPVVWTSNGQRARHLPRRLPYVVVEKGGKEPPNPPPPPKAHRVAPHPPTRGSLNNPDI